MNKDNNDQINAATGMDYIPCYVAALYTQPNGCYVGKAGIDAWDEKRDARKYTENLPVIAHPPCQLWGALAFVNYKRWGGDHNKPENDGGCFGSALANVNRCGGVLEHPAKTRAFKKYGLNKPKNIGWNECGNGWVCEVWQSAYGHRANKATWLYYVGKTKPFELRWERARGERQVGGAEAGRTTNKPTLSKREANATPVKFRDELIKLALHSAAT